MIAFLVTDKTTGARRYLGQIRSGSSGDYALTIPLPAGDYRIEASSRIANAVAEAVIPAVNPDPGGGGGGNQQKMTVSIMVTGDSQRGLILPKTSREFPRGESITVIQLLRDVLLSSGIEFEIKNNAYVSSIGGLKEKDRGALSGWLYRVNGMFPQVGPGEYQVRDGDSVEFVYTCDGGKDVGQTAVPGEEEVVVDQPPQKQEETAKELPVVLPDLTAPQAFDELTRRGIIKGTTHGLEPERAITRAEFITLLCRAGAFEAAPNAKPRFTDVAPGKWYYEAIEGAVKAGIINGCGRGLFRPELGLTRYQAAVILKNLGGVSTDGQRMPLDYERMPEWARPASVYVLNAGLMSDSPDVGFQGTSTISRMEAAYIVCRYMVRSSEGKNN